MSAAAIGCGPRTTLLCSGTSTQHRPTAIRNLLLSTRLARRYGFPPGIYHYGWCSGSLAPRFVGPFSIQMVISPSAVRPQLPRSMRVHPTFHVAKVKSVHVSPLAPVRLPLPPPQLFKGGPVDAVWCLIRSRQYGRGLQYLVDWEGHGPEHKPFVRDHEVCVLSSRCRPCLPWTSLHRLLPSKLTCYLSSTTPAWLQPASPVFHSQCGHALIRHLVRDAACGRLTTLAPVKLSDCRLHSTLLPSVKLCLFT